MLTCTNISPDQYLVNFFFALHRLPMMVFKLQLVSNLGIILDCILLLLMMLFAGGLFGSSIQTPIPYMYILYLKILENAALSGMFSNTREKLCFNLKFS